MFCLYIFLFIYFLSRKKILTAVSTLCVCVCVFQCVMWCHSGMCHCNSHKRSDFWKNLRNGVLLGGLQSFNLTLSEIDAHLRHAGTCLWRTSGDVTITCTSGELQTESLAEQMVVTCRFTACGFVFLFCRGDAAELQTGARCTVLFFPEGEASRAMQSEPIKPAKPHLRVSVAPSVKVIRSHPHTWVSVPNVSPVVVGFTIWPKVFWRANFVPTNENTGISMSLQQPPLFWEDFGIWLLDLLKFNPEKISKVLMLDVKPQSVFQFLLNVWGGVEVMSLCAQLASSSTTTWEKPFPSRPNHVGTKLVMSQISLDVVCSKEHARIFPRQVQFACHGNFQSSGLTMSSGLFALIRSQRCEVVGVGQAKRTAATNSRFK